MLIIYLQTMRRHNSDAFSASSTSLCNYLHTSNCTQPSQSDDEEQAPGSAHVTDEETICLAMEYLFRHGVPRSRFKVYPHLPPSVLYNASSFWHRVLCQTAR